MVTVNDLMPRVLLQQMIDEGYIRPFEHNNGDLIGYNYTPKAQFEGIWNNATIQCRGLVLDSNGNVVARPFPKFFNLGEHPDEDAKRQGMRFEITEKVDGSLGIEYEWNGKRAIATRGSFHSDQAEWATEHLQSFSIPNEPGVTRLYEIVYPQNRIVVDYGDREALVYLGAIDNQTGMPAEPDYLPTIRAGKFESQEEIGDVKARFDAVDDGNHEGVVATFEDGYRVKIKLDEYVRLHRIMSSTSNRTIWEALRAGTDINQLVESVPDEFMQWVKWQVEVMRTEYLAFEDAAREEFVPLEKEFGDDRRTFAEHATKAERPYPTLMFAMLDGKDYADTIWKHLRPNEITYPPIGVNNSE